MKKRKVLRLIQNGPDIILNKNTPVVVLERTRKSARVFKNEFKNQIITAITAAFAFLIALSWRIPIERIVNNIIINLNLKGSAIYVEVTSAVIITVIAVIVLVIFSKWNSKKENNK